MRDLTEAEVEELANDLLTFVRELAEMGIQAVIVIDGRGCRRVACRPSYSQDAPLLLASAYDSLTKYNAAKAN
jgi:hypothetical protein